MIGCGESERNAGPHTGRPADTAGPPAGSGVEDTPTILFLGTSLTAGYGLADDESFPARIQTMVDSAGYPHSVVNAGISGETSAGALRRIDWLLQQPFDILLLETGANDMLRGTDLDSTRANIEAIVERTRNARPEAEIVLAGMMAPPNLGADYAERFARLYTDLAREYDLALVPFLLEGVGGEPDLNLPDGIHPNAEGQRLVARNVWEVLEPLLAETTQPHPDGRAP